MEKSQKSNPAAVSGPFRGHHGVTLMEVALGIMILSILGISVSSLVKTGVDTQISRRNDVTVQTVGINISDDLRMDTRVADEATISGGGNSMTLSVPDTTSMSNPNRTITYTLANGQFSRTANGTTKVYNDPSSYNKPFLTVVCPSTCFTVLNNQYNGVLAPREIQVNEIQVRVASNPGTAIDRNFVPPEIMVAHFRLQAFTFNMTGKTEFQ